MHLFISLKKNPSLFQGIYQTNKVNNNVAQVRFYKTLNFTPGAGVLVLGYVHNGHIVDALYL